MDFKLPPLMRRSADPRPDFVAAFYPPSVVYLVTVNNEPVAMPMNSP